MDLQADAILEVMAQSESVRGPSTSSTASSMASPSTSQTQAQNQHVKGYPKEITQNPVEDKFLCGHCDLILRHPLQSECGHRFCSSCRDELVRLQQQVKCKACEKEGVPEEETVLDLQAMFDDKAATREMKKIPIKCINRGCQWKGTFSDYSTTHEHTCDKKEVECSLCKVLVTQIRLNHHQTKQCPKRTVSCPHCKENMLYEQQEKHFANCPSLPIRCEKCSKAVPRTDMKRHQEMDCVHRTMECPVPDCKAKLPFEQFPSHFNKSPQSAQKHMLFLFSKIVQLEKEIDHMMKTGTNGGVGEASPAAITEVQGADSAQGEPSSGVANHIGHTTGGAEGGTVSSALDNQDKKQLKLHEDLMAVLHGEILRCIRQVEALTAQIEREGKVNKDGFKDSQRKMETLEKKMSELERKLQEFPQSGPQGGTEFGTLAETGDCGVVWRIENFTQVRRAACNGTQPYISSPPFMTGPCGYKMRLRFFANGDGEAKNMSFSIFVQLLKGPFDDILPWPFTGKFYFMIVDLKNFQDHRTVSFSALSSMPAFQKPQGTTLNATAGCALMNLQQFSESLDKHLVLDTLLLRGCVELPESVMTKLNSLNPPGFGRRR